MDSRFKVKPNLTCWINIHVSFITVLGFNFKRKQQATPCIIGLGKSQEELRTSTHRGAKKSLRIAIEFESMGGIKQPYRYETHALTSQNFSQKLEKGIEVTEKRTEKE